MGAHAVSLYRSVLEGLGVDPFAGLTGAQPALACSPEYDTSSDETALPQPKRRRLVSRPQPRDGLGVRQAPSECPVSGGRVAEIDLDAFLSEPRHPQHEALLRLIGTLILDPQGADSHDEPPEANTGKEWSDAELRELGNMLLRGLSIGEIARLLRRDTPKCKTRLRR